MLHKLWFACMKTKIRYHTSHLWIVYIYSRALASAFMNCGTTYHIFLRTRRLSFKTLILKFHTIAFSISFYSLVWTQKSDITQAIYEHFDLFKRFCLCLPQLWHNFVILFITCPLSLEIFNFKIVMVACSISFDSLVGIQKSDMTRATYEHFDLFTRSCKCLHELWHNLWYFLHNSPSEFQKLNF